jgi:hypothetical protein
MKTQPTILEAIADPKLLGHGFKKRWLRKDTWFAWRCFLSSVFNLPFESGGLEVFRKCTGRITAPLKAFKEVFLVCGRRSGKSYLCGAIAVFLAAFKDYSAFLSPGESACVAIVAGDRGQAAIILKYVKGFFASSPVLRSMLVGDLKEKIELSNGISIEILTSDYRAVRGKTLIAVLWDEVAFNSGDSNDQETLNALRPGMASIPDSVLIGLSSPYSKRGVLYNEYQQHYAKDDSTETLVWQADSLTMNPSLNPKSIEAAYQRDPISARSEFGAAFRDSSDGFLSQEVLDACIVRGRTSLRRLANTSYTSFVDMSGGKSDSATLGICHLENDRAILDLLVERGAPHSPEQVALAFAGIIKSFGLNSTTGDRYAAEWVSDAFRKNGVSYEASERSRSQIYLQFLPACLSGQVELLDNPKMIQQFLGLERRPGRNVDIIDHSPGQGHDDCANAAAGCLTLALEGAGLFGVLDFQLSPEWRPRATELLNQSLASELVSWVRNKFGEKVPTPGDDNIAASRSFPIEARLRGLDPVTVNERSPEMWKKSTKCDPCRFCGSSSTVALGLAKHCNQCARDDYPNGRNKVVFATRNGFVERDRPE